MAPNVFKLHHICINVMMPLEMALKWHKRLQTHTRNSKPFFFLMAPNVSYVTKHLQITPHLFKWHKASKCFKCFIVQRAAVWGHSMAETISEGTASTEHFCVTSEIYIVFNSVTWTGYTTHSIEKFTRYY